LPDIFAIDCRAEAARCLTLAHASNDPYIRRSLTKIAESFGSLAEWIDAEVAAGRRKAGDR
jgi:hypothetical protein